MNTNGSKLYSDLLHGEQILKNGIVLSLIFREMLTGKDR